MKRFAYLLIVAMLALNMQAQQAKYVFYMIGDGMGPNQVLATEMYLAELQGKIGRQQLCMTMRGDLAHGTRTVTSECNGVFKEDTALYQQAWMILGGEKA